VPGTLRSKTIHLNQFLVSALRLRAVSRSPQPNLRNHSSDEGVKHLAKDTRVN
jgi:hypothetical protein